jgi:hypothetical protein
VAASRMGNTENGFHPRSSNRAATYSSSEERRPSAGARIRTAEPLLDKVLSLAPLTGLGYPCSLSIGRYLHIIRKNRLRDYDPFFRMMLSMKALVVPWATSGFAGNAITLILMEMTSSLLPMRTRSS